MTLSNSLIPLPPEAEYGPAMADLPNDRWRRFVIACNQPTSSGEVNYTQAAQLAGFAGTRDSLSVTAHRLAHDERIQRALLEEAKRRVGAALPVATAVVIQIATNPKSKDSDKLKAASILMDRGGMPISTHHEVKVVKTETDGERVDRILRLCEELGLDKRQVLGSYGISLPEEITPTAEIEDAVIVEEPDFTGLEEFL